MAQKIPDSPKKHRPKFSGCFPGCFRPSKSPNKVKELNPTKKPSTKKSSWLISWSRKSPKKTSPDVVVEEKIQKIRKESFRVAKLSKKFSSSNHNREFPVDSSAPPVRAPAAAGGDEIVPRQPDKAREEKNRGEIFPENGSSLNSVIKEKKGILFKRNSSLPAVDKNHRISPALSHSASMPPSTSSGKQPAGAVIDGANQENAGALTGKFDQLVGMSIIVVTLLIMVIWGKVCAILCTSAWLYFYPNILRATKFDQPSKHTKSLDVPESKRLKKKVVFEGFLERSHRG